MNTTDMYTREKANQAHQEDIRRETQAARLLRSREPPMSAARPAVGSRLVIALSGVVLAGRCIAVAVAGAHMKDLETQGKYGVKYLKYWVDEATGSVFCLVEAPSKEAAARVHREAHGLVADEIYEFIEGS